MGKEKSFHWTDITAERIIREKGDKSSYTVAAGITPSGTVHIGNFREIITVDLVRKALEKRGKEVRFIYSWDNYDVFRKVPKNMPKQKKLEKYLRKPIVDVPDTFGCHESYAEHNQAAVEDDLPQVNIHPEFLYQAEKYRNGEYVNGIKKALEHTDTIKKILNQHREKPLDESWLPITMFCEQCQKDTLTELKWLGGYQIKYKCECGHTAAFDFKKRPILKLKWRTDWAYRWYHEQVKFEPGGKDHSTTGGSFDTGKDISKEVWNFEAPTYIMYDFINIKGGSGKMSSSSGNVTTLRDVLQIYEPEIVRYLFAGSRPNREFSIALDEGVLNVYEDYDRTERIYYGLEEVNEKKKANHTVAYELSAIGKIPRKMPYQPSFRHLALLVQINDFDVEKVVAYFDLKKKSDKERVRKRAECAANWVRKYAPDEFTFTVQEECQVTVVDEEVKVLHELAAKLEEKEWTDKELHEEIYVLCTNNDFPPKDFFKLAYKVLINKEKGPRLASFMLEIGRERVASLLRKVGTKEERKLLE